MNELELLKPVSRSFYISIRLLPKALREPVAVAYLLARTSDTIADGSAVDVEKRIELLDRFARAIAGKEEAMGDDLAQLRGSPGKTDGENALLGSADKILQSLQNLSPEDQRDIRELLTIITRGQREDLTRWQGQLTALANAEELRKYTYLVARFVPPRKNYLLRRIGQSRRSTIAPIPNEPSVVERRRGFWPVEPYDTLGERDLPREGGTIAE